MATIKVPYLKWRNGRPRWEPGGMGGARLIAAGFKGRDLKDAAGTWLDLTAAIAEAQAINREVEAWRAGGTPRRRPATSRRHPRSCESLYEAWIASPGFARKAASTQRDYKSKARVFLDDRIDELGRFGQVPVTALGASHLYAWWEEIYKTRGHSMANGTMAVVRAMLTHAMPKRLNWRADNPASRLGLEGVLPRVVIWTPSEVARVIETADGMGEPSVADAFVIALHTGQRQSDVLELVEGRATDGRTNFLQNKTRARVRVPFTPQLEQRLAQIRERRRSTAGQVVELDAARHLVISERTGEAYKVDFFRKRFAEVRATAATGNFVSIAGKQFLDLRDTAITRLALAGCTVPEIRAITGHTLESIHRVLKHYLALDDRMAEAAIAKLKVWMEQEGIAV